MARYLILLFCAVFLVGFGDDCESNEPDHTRGAEVDEQDVLEPGAIEDPNAPRWDYEDPAPEPAESPRA